MKKIYLPGQYIQGSRKSKCQRKHAILCQLVFIPNVHYAFLRTHRNHNMIPKYFAEAAYSVLRREEIIVKRILLTGMSGTGKSTVIGELAARGYKAVDADCDEFSEWVEVTGNAGTLNSPVEVDRDWVWREDRIQDLLSTEDTNVLFLSGCAENMRKFLPQFDHIVLLSAPTDVIVERLRTRTNNQYGKHPDEIARVLGLVETVEPLLRRAAGHEINTSACLEDVVATLLRLVQS